MSGDIIATGLTAVITLEIIMKIKRYVDSDGSCNMAVTFFSICVLFLMHYLMGAYGRVQCSVQRTAAGFAT